MSKNNADGTTNDTDTELINNKSDIHNNDKDDIQQNQYVNKQEIIGMAWLGPHEGLNQSTKSMRG